MPLSFFVVPVLLPAICGGVAGSFLTYGLTWVRESRRTHDAYRAPQRAAIADIVTATHELTLRVNAFREAAADPAKGPELPEVLRQLDHALLGVGRALHVGELTIVDAECCQAMGEAFNDFAMLREALQGAGERAAGADKARESVVLHTEALDRDVVALVGSGQKHLSPVQTWRNKRRREEARKRLDAGHLT